MLENIRADVAPRMGGQRERGTGKGMDRGRAKWTYGMALVRWGHAPCHGFMANDASCSARKTA